MDFSRCINCYNCVSACRTGAVGYAPAYEARHDAGRRQAIKTLAAAGAGALLALLPGGLEAKIDSDLIPQKRAITPVPPGSGSIAHFTGKMHIMPFVRERVPVAG